jgi:hypothetical protein
MLLNNRLKICCFESILTTTCSNKKYRRDSYKLGLEAIEQQSSSEAAAAA